MIPFVYKKSLSTLNNYPKVIPKIKKNKKMIFKFYKSTIMKLRPQKPQESPPSLVSFHTKRKLYKKIKTFQFSIKHCVDDS